MTPENFVYWLKGILEDNETNKLESKKFKKIKEKLAEVTGDKPKSWSFASVSPATVPVGYYNTTTKPFEILAQELRSDPPVPDYKQGESV